MFLSHLPWRALCGLLLAAAALTGCERQVADPEAAATAHGAEAKPAVAHAAVVPSAAPAVRPTLTANAVYRNTPVLGELPRAEFDRTMQAITQWVAPQAGCAHCHVDGDFASDAKPTKQTARRMLQMVQHLNADWKPHVGGEGITCYTCHRGEIRPAQRWQPGDAALGADHPFQVYLGGIAGRPRLALSAAQQADSQFALMLHFTESLAADCSACHAKPVNAAAATQTVDIAKESDAAARERLHRLAGNGLRLVQNLNTQHLNPALAITTTALPVGAAKAQPGHATSTSISQVHCASCHQGSRKPPADGAPRARDYAALTLVPTERSGAFTSASAGGLLQAGLPSGNDDRCARAATQAARLGERIPAESGLRTLRGSETAAAAATPLALFAAPDSACALLDLRMQAGEVVEVYVSHAGYTSVRYRRGSTGSEVRGWIRSDQLGPAVTRTAVAQGGVSAPAPSAATAPAAAGLLAAAGDCRGSEAASESAVALRARRQVLGSGRLQFYSAPDESCPLRGVFILPGEPVVALLQASRFTAVHYVNPRTGGQASGWVRSDRLGGG